MESIITWTSFLVGFLTELCLFIWGYVDFFFQFNCYLPSRFAHRGIIQLFLTKTKKCCTCTWLLIKGCPKATLFLVYSMVSWMHWSKGVTERAAHANLSTWNWKTKYVKSWPKWQNKSGHHKSKAQLVFFYVKCGPLYRGDFFNHLLWSVFQSSLYMLPVSYST